MATVNNVVIPNVAPGGSADQVWSQIWALSRAMKKAGWKVLGSGDGTTKDTSDDPENDGWGSGTTTAVSGSDGTLGATAGGRITFTAGSGTPFVEADKGRFLSITGGAVADNNHYHQIEEIVSSTEVRLDARRAAFTPTSAAETNNGSLNYEVFDPTTDALPAGLASVSAWVLMQGPSTVKIPITSAPVAGGASGLTFIRGENVTQGTTNSEGEIIGWTFDSGAGHLVILPRVIGTGAGVYGWDTGETITGGLSGSTVDQVGTALEYRQQCVIRKGSNETTGQLFHQCIEPVGETADDFATLMVDAGCTATVPPGGSSGGNAFPAIGFLSCGDTSIAASKWNGSDVAVNNGNGQIMASDAIWEEDYSADGTWQWYVSNTDEVGNPAQGRGFYRCDDSEPGDLDPFITAGLCEEPLYTAATRINANQSTTFYQNQFDTAAQESMDSTVTVFKGWRRRGYATGDAFQTFEVASLWVIQSVAGQVLQQQPSDADKVATEEVATKVREPVWVVSIENNLKMRKGTIRSLSIVQGGSAWDRYDGGRLIQLSPNNGCMIASPWDETAVPTP